MPRRCVVVYAPPPLARPLRLHLPDGLSQREKSMVFKACVSGRPAPAGHFLPGDATALPGCAKARGV